MKKIGLFLLLTQMLFAGNSIYNISVNGRGGGMGGVELAIPGDATGIFSNPANITTIHPHTFSGTLGASTSFTYVESGEGTQSPDFEVYPLGAFAYAYRLSDMPISFGFGIYPIVGAGASYSNFELGGGLEATLKSQFALIKAVPTMALHITENLSIGASFEVGYSTIESDNFSELAVIGGHKLEADAIAFGGKFGIFYQLFRTTLGVVYTTKMPVRFEGDFEEGDDKQDLEILGFEIPHVFELGIAHAITDNLTIGMDFSYYLWNDSFRELEFLRDNADNSVNPNPLVAPLDWRNQLSMAIGGEYVWGDHTFRLGYNYGENPAARISITPTLSPIIEHHVTIGYGINVGNWTFDFSYDFEIPNTKTSKNPAFLDADQTTSAHIAYVMIRYRFGGPQNDDSKTRTLF
ncbi:OmpP1/FadL family transporter [Candidatus Uabimicrobium amorphum]|uniref:OmpP1/FadL/TodX family outer membrane transporter n=1 Tax=Uabimicrobium amorphum TaxID=2596890 RepID=A0A5S9F693_UABAM|nr:outer membrane protein transport protein [Candidatus Uabimicrobium amorphum]BBM86943.1 OmpP1/FadL/TodX family outer membrane transporter [Candidatus Uabimicrobium amorphum]